MKQLKLLLGVLMLAIAGLAFTACGGDDDIAKGEKAKLVGTWSKTMNMYDVGEQEDIWKFEKNGKGYHKDVYNDTRNFKWSADGASLWIDYNDGDSRHYYYKVGGNSLSLYFESGEFYYTWTKK